MGAFWQIRAGATNDADLPASEEKPLTQEDAPAILAELASTYSKDITNSLGALHHFFERLDQKPVPDAQLPNVEAKFRTLTRRRSLPKARAAPSLRGEGATRALAELLMQHRYHNLVVSVRIISLVLVTKTEQLF
jgi:hypothetical protein